MMMTTATKNDVSWSTDYPFEAHVFDFEDHVDDMQHHNHDAHLLTYELAPWFVCMDHVFAYEFEHEDEDEEVAK